MDKDWAVNFLHSAEERAPDVLLVSDGIRPKAGLAVGGTIRNSQADEVIEVPVGHPFDVKKDRRPLDLELRLADDVNLAIPDGKSLQGMLVFFAPGRLPPAPAAWPKCARQLSDRENAFYVWLRPVLGASPSKRLRSSRSAAPRTNDLKLSMANY